MIYTVADFSSLPPRAMHLRMNVHDKIRWLMSRKGWKQAELASALKVSQPTVNRWLAGADPRGETRERIDDLFYSIVEEFETIDGVLDDVMEDMGLDAGSVAAEKIRLAKVRREGAPAFREVPLVGYVGAGGQVEAIAGSSAETADAPSNSPPGTVAGMVRGRSMLPAYEDGTLLYWSSQLPPEAMVNRRCVVQLGDDRIMVKILRQGSQPNLWTLVSINPAYEDIVDQVVMWAAKIDWVRPA